jgi:gas vesicle protein
MAEEPDQIRDDIELTRAQLAHDVDRLTDKTSPKRVAQRRWSSVKDTVRGVSDRVIGSPSSTPGAGHHRAGAVVDTVKDKAGDVTETVKDKASTVAATVQDHAGQVVDQVHDAPAAVTRRTQGNPVAAGLIAFGAGLLAASLLPTTEVEQRAARRLREQTGDVVEPAKEQLKEAAQSLKADLGGSAQEAVASVKDTAKDAALATKDAATESARNAAAQTRDTAKSATG